MGVRDERRKRGERSEMPLFLPTLIDGVRVNRGDWPRQGFSQSILWGFVSMVDFYLVSICPGTDLRCSGALSTAVRRSTSSTLDATYSCMYGALYDVYPKHPGGSPADALANHGISGRASSR